MKQLHTFDDVFDSQRVFRRLLNAISNPGRRCSIHEECQKLFGSEPAFLAAAITILDAGIRFYVPEDQTLTEQIVLLTHAKPETPQQADYLFVPSAEKLPGIISACKCGTLVNPHESATVIVKVPTGETERTVRLTGPGIDGQMETTLPSAVCEAIILRDQQEYEYPQGIDFIFILPGSEFLCIPRLVRMEEC